MEKQTQFNIWYIIVALIGIMWIRDFWVNAQQVEPVAYSEFLHHLKASRIKEIAITSNAIRGTYKEALPDGRNRFVTPRVDPGLAKDLEQKGYEWVRERHNGRGPS